MKLVYIQSLAELRRRTAAWDDLWWRSDCYFPTSRAELITHWAEHFSARQFLALAVEDQGQLVAALPLRGGRKSRFVSVGQLAANCWVPPGELLLDPLAETGPVLETLATGLRLVPWPLLSFDAIDVQNFGWTRFEEIAAAAGLPPVVRHQYHVGLIDITEDWDAYVASWSSNHRTSVKKSLRRLEAKGELRLHHHRQPAADEIEPLLRQAFEVEDKSWKGVAGTSVLQTPGMFDFYLRQTRRLIDWGQFELMLLTFNGRPIAFDFSYVAKGAISSLKIGYDPEFSKSGPGRLLRFLQLERYFADPNYRLFDTLGILDESKAKWCTRSHPASRLVMPTGGLRGAALMTAYRHLWPHLRKLKHRSQPPGDLPKLGAASFLAQIGRQEDVGAKATALGGPSRAGQ